MILEQKAQSSPQGLSTCAPSPGKQFPGPSSSSDPGLSLSFLSGKDTSQPGAPYGFLSGHLTSLGRGDSECEGLTPALLWVQHRCGRRLEGVQSGDLWRDPSLPPQPTPPPACPMEGGGASVQEEADKARQARGSRLR